MKFNAHSLSFIDDVAIYVENKTAKQNCKEIEIIVKTAFDWAATNNVKFDDDKSELIHFEKSRNASKHKVQLPNGTILEPKSFVKWLGVWLDRKLNFKKHVETRIASANRSFFAIQNLMKSEWGLKPTAVALPSIITTRIIYKKYLLSRYCTTTVATTNFFEVHFSFKVTGTSASSNIHSIFHV